MCTLVYGILCFSVKYSSNCTQLQMYEIQVLKFWIYNRVMEKSWSLILLSSLLRYKALNISKLWRAILKSLVKKSKHSVHKLKKDQRDKNCHISHSCYTRLIANCSAKSIVCVRDTRHENLKHSLGRCVEKSQNCELDGLSEPWSQKLGLCGHLLLKLVALHRRYFSCCSYSLCLTLKNNVSV